MLDEWRCFQRPALHRMLRAGLDLAAAMDDYRGTQLLAGEIARHDAAALDQTGGLLDLLADAIGAARTRLDASGLDPDLVDLDTTELAEAHARMTARGASRARVAPTDAAIPDDAMSKSTMQGNAMRANAMPARAIHAGATPTDALPVPRF